MVPVFPARPCVAGSSLPCVLQALSFYSSLVSGIRQEVLKSVLELKLSGMYEPSSRDLLFHSDGKAVRLCGVFLKEIETGLRSIG